MKEIYREKDVVGNISAIQFGFMDGPTMTQLAHLDVQSPTLYVTNDQTLLGQPHPVGPLSTILGTSQKDAMCSTCAKKVEDCPGHFGFVSLNMPVFHWGYFGKVVTILQCICKSCSRLLLNNQQIDMYYHRALNRISYLSIKPLLAKIVETCKKVKTCPHCESPNGITKKHAPMKVLHEKFRSIRKDDIPKAIYRTQYGAITEFAPKLASDIPDTPYEIFTAVEVLRIFDKITKKDASVLCMNAENSHPRDLLLTRIPIAPNCIRPSVLSDLKTPGSNEDDITSIYGTIVFLNSILARPKHSMSMEKLQNTYDLLQFYVSLMINTDSPMPPDTNPVKFKAGFVQRLKGKHGRFRGNLSGKRVNFSSRTVISPDPNLRIDQVGVPVAVAKVLTYPERVTEHNIELMKQLVRNGPDEHPGAYTVERKIKPGEKISLRWKKRADVAQNLREGDKVERHLMDGDTVLFNRQPSLHKMSIMAHKVRVLPCRTFRFNECVCGPYNADFDGDEMNLHLPQTEEARAEARTLMGVTNNLVTPRSGSLIIGATQDFLTGAYLLTQKDKFFDKKGASRLLMVITDIGAPVLLPKPAIIKPVELWTGKQLFSLIMKPNDVDPVKCNLVVNKCKDSSCTYRNELCPHENFIHIRNSELLSGALDKSHLGAGSKKNIFYTILKDYGKEYTAEAMWRVSRISVQFLLSFGFTIGIGDLSPSVALLTEKERLLSSGYAACKRYIELLKSGDLECSPGCNAEESLEQVILRELSIIREKAGNGCIKELHSSNPALVMSQCGSKGSIINISQMIACVGQQAINGHRVPNGFTNRSLPYYKHHSKLPEAKGFVSNSFFSGLTPSEFLFHTMGGREGLVDTAVKTAETGYMQRRLVKCLEDLYVAYDGTVRTSTQNILQFKYGDDGLDPTNIETSSSGKKIQPPLDFERILYHVKAVKDDEDLRNKVPVSAKEYLSSKDVKQLARDFFVNLTDTNEYNELSSSFKESIIKFLDEESIKMKKAELMEEKLRKIAPKVKQIRLRPLTYQHLVAFLYTLVKRYVGSSALSADTCKLEAGPGVIIEPGTGVGALCAQSIGEPATQMTLKTFHFAGVASMNITQGVPRIKEIINATKNISTPVIDAQLLDNRDSLKARQVKARIEKTLLGEICEFIQMVANESDMFFIIKLSAKHINLLQLKVSAEVVKYKICTSKLVKIRENEIEVVTPRILLVRPNKQSKEDSFHQMQHIIRRLRNVVIMGLENMNRAVIHQREPRENEDKEGGPVYQLLVEGEGLDKVIATHGVDGTRCTSNNIKEVRDVLGIEAARQTIITEITSTMNAHGLSVDCRHVNLLADHMTCQGAVHGITRHGLVNVKESILTLASFEKTSDHLFEASFHNQLNEINGVSDCIIMGKPINLGTGLFKLMQQHKREDVLPTRYKLSSKQLEFLEMREQESRVLRSVPLSSIRPGIISRRSLLFDNPELHLPFFR